MLGLVNIPETAQGLIELLTREEGVSNATPVLRLKWAPAFMLGLNNAHAQLHPQPLHNVKAKIYSRLFWELKLY